ncbi:NAD(P)H-quinone oxidoreductase subunit 2, chloroplastic [subsurface metagenome]
MVTYLSLILIVPIVGAVLLVLFEQMRKYLKKIRICTDCLNHIFANVVALTVFVLAIISIFVDNFKDLNTTADLLLEFGKYGNLEAILISIFSFLVLMAVLFSVDYMKGKKGLGYYYALILTLLTGLSAVVMSSNFFTLFIGWELFALSAYSLVAFDRAKRGAVEASLKYFIMSTVGSMLVLLATALTYGYYGTVSFDVLVRMAPIGQITGVISALYIVGFGVTAAMLFLNAWLPDAHSNAPSTISALLSGIVVKAGAFAIYRTIYWGFSGNGVSLPNTSVFISWLGILTMIEGNYLVFSQFKRKDIIDLKRILAYSTTVHLGYVILGIGAGTAIGLEASVMHIFTHSLGKGALFLLSGTMIAAVGSRDIRDMKGLGRRSPFIAIVLTTSLLSLAGIPITGGFVSKLLVILSVYGGNHDQIMNLILVIFAVINSVLALGGYLYILKYIVFDPPEAKAEEKLKIPKFEAIPLTIMMVIVILLGVWPGKVFEYIVDAIGLLPLWA